MPLTTISQPRWQARTEAVLLQRRRYLFPALAVGYFLFWTVMLTISKSAELINFDSAEAYAWGQQLAWGYGKHPPVSGWIAWAWFSIFPARDWAVYGLAMAVTGATFALLWMLARQIVDRQRASLMACLLLAYPILNFKGYRYNADLALMPFIVLVVLTLTIAFERRTVLWGVALGLASALAVLTKYWGAWAIVAVGIAALLHPDRKRFFLSPVPYVAGSVFVLAMMPHVLWVLRSDFEPFRYAMIYTDVPEWLPPRRALTGAAHVLALFLPVVLAAVVALWPSIVHRKWNAEGRPFERARNLWIIVGVLAFLPPITAASLGVAMRSDWSIPMYTMVPLAFVAFSRLAITERTVVRAAAFAFAYCLVAALIFPAANTIRYRLKPNSLELKHLDTLARTATDIWHQRFGNKLKVVAGLASFAAPISFYSPDHPRLFTEADPALAPWIDPGALDSTGFLGICPVNDTKCVAQISVWRPSAEQLRITTKHSAGGHAVDDGWVLLLAPPQPKVASR